MSFNVPRFRERRETINLKSRPILNTQIRGIVVPHPPGNKFHLEDKVMVMIPIERASHNDHACQISMLNALSLILQKI